MHSSIQYRNILIYFFFAIVVLLPYGGAVILYNWYKKQLSEIENASIVIIDKEAMKLKLVDYKGLSIKEYDIACGAKYGNKKTKGDMKTPEGVFHISDIQDASFWSHDFGDGNGEIEGAYGPYFIRLSTPGFSGIGIHGTHDPESIGNRVTEGCIRMRNDNVSQLKELVRPGTTVIILPSRKDVMFN